MSKDGECCAVFMKDFMYLCMYVRTYIFSEQLIGLFMRYPAITLVTTSWLLRSGYGMAPVCRRECRGWTID